MAKLASKSTPSLPLEYINDPACICQKDNILVWVGRGTGLVIKTFVTEADEMVGINRLDVGGDILCPSGDRSGGAGA